MAASKILGEDSASKARGGGGGGGGNNANVTPASTAAVDANIAEESERGIKAKE